MGGDQNNENVGIAMALVVAAGAATGVGGCVVFFPSLARLASRKTLAGSLGLSAGVMVYLSFSEVFVQSQDAFQEAGFTLDEAHVYVTFSFFAGLLFMILLNHVVTSLFGVHHHHRGSRGRRKAAGAIDNASSSSSDNSVDASEESKSIVPCPCHDENPIQTLEKVKDMAESMHEHPHQAHPGHGLHRGHNAHDHHEETQISSIQEQLHRLEAHVGGLPSSDEHKSVGHHGVGDDSKSGVPHPKQLTMPSITTDSLTPVDIEAAAVQLSTDEDDATPSLVDDGDDHTVAEADNKRLMLLSFNTAFAIALHNFPEGLATFTAAVEDPGIGAVLGVAIAIHNIPEGLCVAMPIYYATGKKWQAFGWACMSGISEPIAGLLGWAFLSQSFSRGLYGFLFGFVAGLMVTTSVRELLPTAHRYDPEDTVVTYCFIFGMAVMAISLILLQL